MSNVYSATFGLTITTPVQHIHGPYLFRVLMVLESPWNTPQGIKDLGKNLNLRATQTSMLLIQKQWTTMTNLRCGLYSVSAK